MLNNIYKLCTPLQAVRLESVLPQYTRYMVVVSTNGRQDTEESVVLGMDFSPSDRCVSVIRSLMIVRYVEI